MTTVQRTTELDAAADHVWHALAVPDSFVLVAGDLVRFPAAERHDAPWRDGDVIDGWTFLFSVVPWSRHRLAIHRLDDAERRLESRERGGLIRRWDHVIQVTPIDERRCRYEDRIEIEAGLFTPVVAAWARVLYAYRQRNWRRLAPVLTAVADRSEAG